MVYEGLIKYEEGENPSRSNAGRLLKELLNRYGLVTKGFYFSSLIKIIRAYKASYWDAELFSSTPREVVNGIVREIINGHAPLIRVGYEGINEGQALTAVGFEKIGNHITKIFCLDPGSIPPSVALWNSYIDVSNLRRNCSYISCGSTGTTCEWVRLTDYIVFKSVIMFIGGLKHD